MHATGRSACRLAPVREDHEVEPTVAPLRAADLRFLLPSWPARVAVLGLPPSLAHGLRAAGHEVVGADREPDAVLCDPASVVGAGRPGGGLVVLGRGATGRRALARAGLRGRDWLLLPGPAGPSLAVPARAPAASRAGLVDMVGAQSRAQQVRNAVVRRCLDLGALPPLPVACVWSPGGGWPALAEAAGVAGPCVVAYRGQVDGNRVVAVVPGRRTAVKVERAPGLRPSGVQEAHALRQVAALPAVARRSPRLSGTGELAGPAGGPVLSWLAQSQGSGGLLLWVLQTPARRAEGLQLLRDMEEWLADVARTTRRAEPARLPDGLPGPARARLAALPAVFVHADLGTWNVVVDRAGLFTVLDWEDGGYGLPLSDLLYLLTDGLGALDGARTTAERTRHALDLHRGLLPASGLLFAALRRAARACGVGEEAVGALALATWMHHAAQGGPLVGGEPPPAAQLAQAWLTDPSLGASWPALTDWGAR